MNGKGFSGRLLALALAAVAAAADARAQQAKPNIANDVDDVKTTRPKNIRPRPGGGARPPMRRGGAPNAIRPGATPLSVTFITGVAGADIFVSRDAATVRLGTTGPDGKLALKLAPGAHDVTASRAGRPAVRRRIEVRPGNTTFNLDLAGRAAPTTVATAAARPATAEEIFIRFLDPKRTDAVTLNDWLSAQAETGAAYARSPYDPQTSAQALFAQGQVAYLRGDYPNALVAFNNAALALPTSALAYYGLGNAYYATNQLGEALRAYKRAIELNSQLALAYRGAGDVLSRQGKSKESVDYYNKARALGYASGEVVLNTARNLMRDRRWQQALTLLLELSRTRPSAEVFIRTGDCYVGLKQPMSAAVAYRQAVRHDPGSAQAHYKLGEVSYQMREYAAALEALERALALDSTGAVSERARAREMADKAAARLGQRR